ncbi:MAG: spore coat protein, partial [Clostridia bacterium]|nr:spore coat protein [Clostridia bacterium]
MTLTQKETDLLKDMKGQEQLCIQKYEKYAAEACSDELKTLFLALADVERGHLSTVTDIMNGKVGAVGGSGSSPLANVSTAKVNYSDEQAKKKDAMLCSDMLTTEKHVSSLYNTGIFEFSDPQARNMLNH